MSNRAPYKALFASVLLLASGTLAKAQVSGTQSTAYLPIAGGTLTGNLLFTDNTYNIGALGSTRPARIYATTSIDVGASGSTQFGDITIQNAGYSDTHYFAFQQFGSANASSWMRDVGNGNFTHTLSFGAVLSTSDVAATQMLALNAALTSCTGISTNGSQTAACTVSDARVKNDNGYVSPLAALWKVLEMPDLHRFTYKSYRDDNGNMVGLGPSGEHYGWFAQDIQHVAPELVKRGRVTPLTPDGVLEFDRAEVGPFAISAVKALIVWNAALSVALVGAFLLAFRRRGKV